MITIVKAHSIHNHCLPLQTEIVVGSDPIPIPTGQGRIDLQWTRFFFSFLSVLLPGNSPHSRPGGGCGVYLPAAA